MTWLLYMIVAINALGWMAFGRRQAAQSSAPAPLTRHAHRSEHGCAPTFFESITAKSVETQVMITLANPNVNTDTTLNLCYNWHPFTVASGVKVVQLPAPYKPNEVRLLWLRNDSPNDGTGVVNLMGPVIDAGGQPRRGISLANGQAVCLAFNGHDWALTNPGFSFL